MTCPFDSVKVFSAVKRSCKHTHCCSDHYIRLFIYIVFVSHFVRVLTSRLLYISYFTTNLQGKQLKNILFKNKQKDYLYTLNVYFILLLSIKILKAAGYCHDAKTLCSNNIYLVSCCALMRICFITVMRTGGGNMLK